MKSIRDLEEIPWFAVAGIFVVLSMLLYTTELSGFAEVLFPTYMTQALLYFAIAYAFKTGASRRSFIVFLMACVWFMNQVLHWGGAWGNDPGMMAASCWLLFIAQAALAYMFFTKSSIKYVGNPGIAWAYAAVWIVLLFAAGKLWLNLSYMGATPGMWTGWGAAIFLLSLGYAVKPLDRTAAVALKVLGALIAVVVALSIGGSGLAVL